MVKRCGALVLAMLLLSQSTSLWGQSREDLFAKAFGGRQQAQVSEVSLPVTLGALKLGAARVRIRGQTVQRVGPEFCALLEALLTEDAAARLAGLADQDGWFQPDTLGPVGIGVSYDAQRLTLALSVEPALRRPYPLSFSLRGMSAELSNPILSADFSAYANLTASVARFNDEQDLNALEASGAVQWRGWVLEYLLGWSHRDATVFNRGPLTVVRDRPVQRLRYRYGDLSLAGSPFLGGRGVFGFSISREDDLNPLDPPFVGLEQRLDLVAPADLEVSVNGRPVGRLPLPAGRYDINDVPLGYGPNDVNLTLVGADGQRSVIDQRLIRDQALLARGRDRFLFGLGIARELGGGSWDYDASRWVLAGRYARGITNSTTLRGSFVHLAEEHAQVFGAGGEWGLGAARLSADLSAQFADSRSAEGALALGLRNYPGALDEINLSWRVAAVVASRGYLRFDAPDSRPRRQLDGDLSFDLTRASSLSGYVSLSRGGGIDDTQRAGLALSWRPSSQVTLRVGAEYRNNSEPGGDWGGSLYLSYRPRDKRHNLTFRRESLDQRTEVGYLFSDLSQSGGMTANLRRVDDGLGGSSEAFLSASNTRAEMRVTAQRLNPLDALRDDVEGATVSVQSALLFADGHVAVSRPVSDAFAIFVGPEDLPDLPILVDARDQDFIGTSEGPGPAVHRSLRAHEPRRVTISLPGYPLDRDPGQLRPDIKPGYRSGALVNVGGPKVLTARLSIRDGDGQAVALTAFSLVAAEGGEEVRGFTNRQGIMLVGGLDGGDYVLRRGDADLTVLSLDPAAAGPAGVIDVGEFLWQR